MSMTPPAIRRNLPAIRRALSAHLGGRRSRRRVCPRDTSPRVLPAVRVARDAAPVLDDLRLLRGDGLAAFLTRAIGDEVRDVLALLLPPVPALRGR
ncbi:MAG TPA: hypothetical protein VH062_10260 [Polyangiaceae bacterium]|nr:hypothetical protein [Polyangiaceae bacterium]